MKKLVFLVLFLLFIGNIAFSAKLSKYDNKPGNYEGKLFGLLVLSKDGNENNYFIVDFQGTTANLKLEHDNDEVYDSYYENYEGKSTSGKTLITYSTYSSANGLIVKIGDDIYERTTIDGASAEKVDGIIPRCRYENNIEYLTLEFSKAVEMNTLQSLLSEEAYSEELLKKVKKIYVLPGTVLLFRIYHK